MHDLTDFQRDLLVVIDWLDAPSGSALRGELQLFYDTVIHDKQLYPTLDALVAMALVEKGQQDGRTNAYTLTHLGHQEIEERVRKTEATGTGDGGKALPDWYRDRH